MNTLSDAAGKRLTVIIPFLNEGVEVDFTLQSIRETSQDVDIIIINDASTDRVDYISMAKKHRATYIEHTDRMGVAFSRDEGVSLAETDYFLLLDAHMRFYQSDWKEIIVQELQKNPRSLLCCQTTPLRKDKNGNMTKNMQENTVFGAYIDFSNSDSFCCIKWNKYREDIDIPLDIPCVLGAAYASNKWYWKHLHGLKGLKFYGHDESFISLKVWLEGGKCQLLQKVTVGHIYRTTPPYELSRDTSLYNIMYIAELLFDYPTKLLLFTTIQKKASKLYPYLIRELSNNRDEILAEKAYYANLFTHEFNFILSQNKAYQQQPENNKHYTGNAHSPL